MNRWFLSVFAILCILVTGCEDTDVGMVIRAGADAIRAVTLDDEEVAHLAARVARESDLKHAVAPLDHPHALRLRRLVGDDAGYDGQGYNFKVYLSPTINAFAMADGTIRIYGGLMDFLDDRELLFVIGHEMGHVAAKHIRKKIMLAYAGSAVRKAIASQQNEIGAIAGSAVGAFVETLLNAQFSQQEEREADDYGVLYLRKRGYDRQPAVSALNKLATLGNGHSFLSSHPSPGTRANRLMADGYDPRVSTDLSLKDRIWRWLKALEKRLKSHRVPAGD